MSESGWRPVYEVEGRRVPPTRLVRTRDGRWAEPALVWCPNGHRLKAGTGKVGAVLCRAIPERLHRTDLCLVCGVMVYTPPRVDACRHPYDDGQPPAPQS